MGYFRGRGNSTTAAPARSEMNRSNSKRVGGIGSIWYKLRALVALGAARWAPPMRLVRRIKLGRTRPSSLAGDAWRWQRGPSPASRRALRLVETRGARPDRRRRHPGSARQSPPRAARRRVRRRSNRRPRTSCPRPITRWRRPKRRSTPKRTVDARPKENCGRSSPAAYVWNWSISRMIPAKLGLLPKET